MKESRKMTQWGCGPRMILIFILISIIFYVIEYFLFYNFKLNYILEISNNYFYLIGIIWFALGIPIWFLGAKEIGTKFKQGRLITTGIFKYIQHPIYCGFIIFYIPAVLFVLKSLGSIVLPFVFYLILKQSIKYEEKYLKEKFGKEYLKYKKQTGKIIPKLI